MAKKNRSAAARRKARATRRAARTTSGAAPRPRNSIVLGMILHPRGSGSHGGSKAAKAKGACRGPVKDE